MISVLIPVFNCVQYLGKTVFSVLQQSFQDFEIIILDDCSTDYSYELALELSKGDSRIKVFRNEVNLGMLENWNKGIELCHQPYFVKLDADDLWEPDFLQQSMEVLNKYPDVGIVFTKYIEIDKEGNRNPDSEWELPAFAIERPFSCIPLVKSGPDKMLQYPILRQGLSVMRRSIIDEIGGYQYLETKETQASTDTEFYFRIGAHHNIFCIDENLYLYRIHKESISRKDAADGLGEKKLHEIRMTIIKYYFKNTFISTKEYKKFIKQSELIDSPSLINNYYKTGNTSKAVIAFLRLLVKHPLFTLKFYGNRIAEKYLLRNEKSD